MYTHCPHCDTCFRVTSEQLKAARGNVRCGRCFGTFNALENLVDEPPQPEPELPSLTPATAPKPEPLPAPEPKPALEAKPAPKPAKSKPAAKTRPAAPIEPKPEPEPEPKPEPEEEPEVPAQEEEIAEEQVAVVPVAPVAPAPKTPEQPIPVPATVAQAQLERSQQLVEEIQSGPTKPARNHFWLWSLLSLLFMLTFAAQYTYFNLKALAQQPQLRPALEAFCNLAKCSVPLIKAPYMITLVERDIRNDPTRQNVLLVKARIINKAPYTQAYPLMELSLHDITGHVIAARRFTPSEYLAKEVDQKTGMAPQQPADIALELADPGKEAVGFEFEFY